MDNSFEIEYKRLNDAQTQAVDQIDGPLLVMAGPGTGKTQLLSARVANILIQTDILPQNILCLTFTENGAANMRERLTRFIGQAAYDVNISTYHAFGGELIRKYPEYFSETRLQSPIDELAKHQIISEIVRKMSYQNPLKQTQYHLGDLIGTISEVKRGLLDTESLTIIAKQNAKFIQHASQHVSKVFENFTSMPRKLNQATQYFEDTVQALISLKGLDETIRGYVPLKQIIISELQSAIDEAKASGKTTPLTKWKNTWLAKNSQNQFVIAGELQNRRIEALAEVLEQYQQELNASGLYDFDDMILRSVYALRNNNDLKYSLQEQYQYILLDEFQDTNAAQFELVKLLTDNPVNEGRPNVLAVGDDDQAIYAFQGAHYSNMVDFYRQYKDVTLIPLVQNYRSHKDILHVAHNVAEQIEARLHHQFENLSKVLSANSQTLPKESHIERHEFASDIAEYDWIAKSIATKIKHGINPNEIAVLAPRHKYLEALVTYLNQYGVPVAYEKRENILEATQIRAITAMCKLTLALADNDESSANSLWAEVLSYDFWEIPIKEVWKISWKVSDGRGQKSWTQALLESEHCKKISLFFIALAAKSYSETAETMLDYIIGNAPLRTNDDEYKSIISPLKSYYTNQQMRSSHPELFYEILSNLTVIRTRLRDYQASQKETMLLNDFLSFINLYESSDTRMLNSSPYHQQKNAVQLMTVFKAKGLEFEHVYLPSCLDDVWGDSSRANSNKLTLPANLAPIRHAGANADERLRIFFVAITRAKHGLYLTSYDQSFSGKTTKRLKYLDERSEDGTTFRSHVLPQHAQINIATDNEAVSVQALENNWQSRHIQGLGQANLVGLLQNRLQNYQLSPTHLNNFFDLVYCGPEAFFFSYILCFPSAPTASEQYGSAIHETLQWIQLQVNEAAAVPAVTRIIKYFKNRITTKHLSHDETTRLIERGERSLKLYVNQRSGLFKPGNISEYNFRNEGVFVAEAHMSGKIDLLEIDKENKTITVVDYKTGTSYSKWASDIKLHKYKMQLYCYKIIIERSRNFKGYKVTDGRIEFIEPDSEGIIRSLELKYEEKELQRVQELIQVMWRHVQELNFPDVSNYATTFVDSKKFESDMLKQLD
jgi:DNA helicase-2/ATP-dependent DNA helicase PcrA